MLTIPTLVKNEKGAVYLNPAFETVKDGVLIPRQMGIAIPAATVATNPAQSDYMTLECPTDAWAEIWALVGGLTGVAAVTQRIMAIIKDTSIVERKLMNRAILFNHIFGTIQNPAYVKDSATPMWMDPLQTLNFQFYNPSLVGAATADFLALCTKYQRNGLKSRKIQEEVKRGVERYRQITPYWFTTDSSIPGTGGSVPGIQIPAGGTVDAFFTASSDTELVLSCVYGTAIPAAGAVGDTQEIVQCQLWDAQTDRPLQNQPFTLNTGFGTPAFPHYFKVPIVVQPCYKLRARFTSLITNVATDLFVTLHGCANYNYPEKYLP